MKNSCSGLTVKIKDDDNLVISDMTDGQYIPETESEMDSDQGPNKTKRPSHSVEDTGILEFQIPPGSIQDPLDQDKVGNNIPDATSAMVPNGSNISQDASVVKSDVISLSTQNPPAQTVSQSPITTTGSQSSTVGSQQPQSTVNVTAQLSSSPQTQCPQVATVLQLSVATDIKQSTTAPKSTETVNAQLKFLPQASLNNNPQVPTPRSRKNQITKGRIMKSLSALLRFWNVVWYPTQSGW